MKKNILIFCHGYNPPFVDVVNQYATLFDRQQYSVTVVYLAGIADPAIQEKIQADEVIFLDKPKQAKRGLKIDTIKTMLTLCRQKQFEFVICHRYKPTYIMSWIRHFVPFPHFISVMHELGTLRRLTRRLFLYLFASKNLVLAGVSNAVKKDMLSHAKCLKNKFIVLPNVLDVQRFTSQLLTQTEARAQLGLASEDFIYGNIGRLVPNKDQATLIQAFATIAPKFPNAKLVIIGTGKLADELKALINRLNLGNRVILAGFIPDAARFMSAFDVYVSSSKQEAFGRVILEAMAAKLPIIATAVHGVPEVLGNTGILTPPGDIDSLTNALHHLAFTLPETRNTQAAQSYQRLLNQFSLTYFHTYFWQSGQTH